MPEADSRRAAIFFDRDGTLADEIGYVNHISRFHVLPWAAEAVRRVNQAGLIAVVVTNQSGVARRMFPETLVKEIHRLLDQKIKEGGGTLAAIYYCPHSPNQECDCRKPKPGMLLRAEQELGIDLTRSYLISDRYMDVEMAHLVGARAALVMTGYGLGDWEHYRGTWPRQPEVVAANSLEAVEEILKLLKRR
ncbi:MAG TPA: HAD family hydrolase [Candidatus Acidoferrales bacterium]